MNLYDIENIYQSNVVKKNNKSEIKINKTIEEVFKIIADNPDIYVKQLIEISGKCSEIMNRCVNKLVKEGRVTKIKYYGHNFTYRVRLNIIINHSQGSDFLIKNEE